MSICILNVVSINECNVPDQFKISEMTTFLILNNTFSLMSFKTTIAFVSHMTLLIQTVSKRPLLLISPSENWGLWILYHFTALQLLMTGSQIVPICTTLYLFIINFKLICFNFFDRLFFYIFIFCYHSRCELYVMLHIDKTWSILSFIQVVNKNSE